MKKQPSRFQFSHRKIDALPVPPADHRSSNVEYSDLVESGLRIAVYKSGRKSWRHRYTFLGKKCAQTIGEYPAINLDMARECIRENKRLLAKDIDPKEEREQARNALTFQQFADEHYLPFAKKERKSYKDIENRLKLRLLPKFGSMLLTQIGKRHVSELHRQLKDEVSAITANRYLTQLGGMFGCAVEWGYAPENPVRGIRQFDEGGPRTRYLADDELVSFTTVLWQDCLSGNQSSRALFMLLSCGHRVQEVLSQRWENFNLENGVGYLADAKKKGKPRPFPLNSHLLKLLKIMYAERNPDCPWLFPSKTSASGHQEGMRRTFQTTMKKAGVENLRQHDLRRTFASGLARKGVSAMAIRDLLGHADVRTTQKVYAHIDLGTLRDASDAFGDEISAALN